MVNLCSKNWEIKDIDTVLFDKDGTFIDSHIYWGRIIEMRIQAVMKKFGISSDNYYQLCLSLGYDLNIEKLIPQGPIALLAREDVIKSLLAAMLKIGVESDVDTIADIFKEVHSEFHKEIYDYIRIIDGAEDLFKRLKEKNVTMAVVTSDVYDNAVSILKYLNLDKYFSLVIGKDNCTKAKKTGEPALIAIDKLGANPNRTISVGDADMDALMAKNAGLKASLLVSTGQVAETELLKYSEYTVNNLSEVLLK